MPAGDVHPSWNPFTDLQLLFQYHFMQNAYLAGTIVALVAGVAGYFMVLRGQSFAGHALAHVGFAGATGALLFGISPVIGLLVVGIGAALGISGVDISRSAAPGGNAVAIGAVYTFCLGLGVLFLQLYPGQADNVYSILFGAVLGISDHDVAVVAVTGVITLGAFAVIGRPLLFASIDPDVATARGVPVRTLSTGFLVLLAFAVAQSVQVVGTLLIYALLVTPAATAQRMTARPAVAVGLSALLALIFTWLGLAVAYFAPHSVVGFYVTTFAFATYALVRLIEVRRRRAGHRGREVQEQLAA